MDKLIINYLIGEISLEDQHKLKKWLEEDESHPVILEQMEKFWAQGEMKFPDRKQAVFSRLKSEIDKLEESDQFTKPSNRFTLGQLLRYAAVVLIASLISIYAYISFEVDIQRTRSTINYLEKVSSPGQKITTTLPDGTKVKLNSESKIIVPEHFPADIREVTLMGEAFFEVVPDPNKPFIVHFNNNEVEVLGTSFDVKEDTESHQKMVAVKTGKVAVNNKANGEPILLDPLQMVVETQSGTLNKLPIMSEEAVFGWTDNKLVFDDNQYKTVFKEVSKWFGVEIEVGKELDEGMKYTAVFDNPTLDEVLMSTSRIFKFNYKINENKVIIE